MAVQIWPWLLCTRKEGGVGGVRMEVAMVMALRRLAMAGATHGVTAGNFLGVGVGSCSTGG
uniref:Uncharacterized protein n=1 Tax=Oryza sativa subsp. japonica TaxID=39947 RepID=Q6K899_ORYSJ|nr:hypothetical protein [Oryza sativa Japonica Group]